MNLKDFFTLDNDQLSFQPERASAFAKRVAGDFNPLHDPDNKRFCVPGDLLFSVVLHQYGLCQAVKVHFAGMVDGATNVTLPETLADKTIIKDGRDRDILIVECEGEKTSNEAFIAELTEQYVMFSGETFPGVLEPLMRQHNVMINPTRPLVIYQSMHLSMNQLEGERLQVTLSDANLEVDGKKGSVNLGFDIKADGALIGTGAKTMVLGGLREYDADSMQSVIDDYNALKTAN